MCGIFGHLIESPVDKRRSRHALDMLKHRGPDQWGDWHDRHVYMGHRRLSILDLSERGRQPMVDEESGVVTSVNGEIYNFRRLRQELQVHHEFTSESDSEVVLHGYKQWGIEGLLERIDGMYAFCVYDRERQRIYLARDRVGIKPVYYALINQQLVWASELKAIRTFFGEDRLRQDETALYDFLTYLYVPTPKTLYRDVFKLPPAHWAEFDCRSRKLEVRPYWALSCEERDISLEDAGAELRRLVDQSVSEQLMSDVPVGVFLSGGLDSGIVAQAANNGSDKIQTFTIKVDDPAYDESSYARMMADHIGTEHHERLCGPEDVSAWIEHVQDWYDEPFADTSAVPTALVSRFARESITVALSGDGGDELFGGYTWYGAMKQRFGHNRRPALGALRPLTHRLKRVMPSSLPGRALRRLEFDHVLDELEYFVRLQGGLLPEDKEKYRTWFGIDTGYDDYWLFRKFWSPDLPLATRLQVLDFHTYLPDDILTKVDRASMQVALEVRVPLLSLELIDFAFSLPESIRYVGGSLKGIVKEAYKDRLPGPILAKPKQGFGMPSRLANPMGRKGVSVQESLLECHYKLLLDSLRQ